MDIIRVALKAITIEDGRLLAVQMADKNDD
jgi:hypothetical protein